MHWNNSETVVNTSTGRQVNETMQLIDSEGNVVTEFTKLAETGSITAEVDASQCVTDDTVAVKKITVELDNDAIKALPTASVTILPAQAGKIISPRAAYFRCEAAADYTNIDDAAQIRIKLGGDMLAPIREDQSSRVSSLLAGGDPNDHTNAWTTPLMRIDASNFGGTSGYYDSDVVGLPLTVSMDNGASGNLTGGDAANVLKVTVEYTLIDA